ncbi:hypothetical protein [Micromonospora sp. WMMD998]|uniref:hypothetical protein n=1 Tax=Micromonospora sp. WMMD998 TaxID=3016092 RepID=UPI00249CB1FC|nr:hypothetical protein [Micromonospora sp. WMMD998]WFE40473.1 hypothetical protein O7619_19320 [Micromonospora sp. WMMD998]
MAPHALAPARSARARTRALLGLPLLLALLAPVACDDTDGTPASAPAGRTDDTGLGDLGAAGGAPPACPFTAAQVSEIVGRTMRDEGNCLFGDGKGVASLTVTTASVTAGRATYDYQHEQAGKQYDKVVGVDRGDQGYLAVKDIRGEAVLIDGTGTYTVTISSFGSDPAGNERILRRALDAIPA